MCFVFGLRADGPESDKKCERSGTRGATCGGSGPGVCVAAPFAVPLEAIFLVLSCFAIYVNAKPCIAAYDARTAGGWIGCFYTAMSACAC